MNSNQINPKQIFPTIIIFGLLGGVLLIGTTLLPIKGWWTILTYAIVMFATMLKLKANKEIELNYLKTVVTGTVTFMIMTLVLYFYIMIFENPDNHKLTLWGHSWRLMAALGFALASGAILGFFFRKRNHDATLPQV